MVQSGARVQCEPAPSSLEVTQVFVGVPAGDMEEFGKRREDHNRAAWRCLAKIRPTQTAPALPPEEAVQASMIAFLLAQDATAPATAYVVRHGQCALCRVQVRLVSMKFVEIVPW